MLKEKKKRLKTKLGPAQQVDEESPEQRKAVRTRKLAKRWGGFLPIVADGFVPVPCNFLKYSARLKPLGLAPAEILFVINLMYHKWDSASPYPSYKTLAARMGISIPYARDLARRLEIKGYLKRQIRVGQTNRFDLNPLFIALNTHVQGMQEPTEMEGA